MSVTEGFIAPFLAGPIHRLAEKTEVADEHALVDSEFTKLCGRNSKRTASGAGFASGRRNCYPSQEFRLDRVGCVRFAESFWVREA